MPVYNGEAFLASAVESILTQTLPDFELIISDNASTDGTESICRDFAARDPRIRYYRNDINLGAAQNFNRVFELSSAEYFKWATSDDVSEPRYLQSCVDVLERESDVVLCYGKTKIIDEAGEVLQCYEDGLNLICDSAGGRFLQLKFNMRLCNAFCGVIRSSALRKTRLIQNHLGSDECLLVELCLMGKFQELPEYLFLRRTHPGSSMVNKEVDTQLEFYDPKLKGKVVCREWRHLYENLMAVRRAPIRARGKMLPTAFLLASFACNPAVYLRELWIAIQHIATRRRHDVPDCELPIEAARSAR